MFLFHEVPSPAKLEHCQTISELKLAGKCHCKMFFDSDLTGLLLLTKCAAGAEPNCFFDRFAKLDFSQHDFQSLTLFLANISKSDCLSLIFKVQQTSRQIFLSQIV